MDVIRVKVDDIVLVHEQYMLFRFQVSPAHGGHAHLDFYLPYFEDDGRAAPVDKLSRDTLEIGEPLQVELEGNDTVPGGVVEITVSVIEGDDVTVCIKLPDGWGALPQDEAFADCEDGDLNADEGCG